MPALFAILISGVLLNVTDQPIPNSHFVFVSTQGKRIEVVTDKEGNFRANLVPGTYRVQIADKTWETITVGRNTPKLKLRQRFLEPHVIEIIQGTPRDIMRVPLDPSLNPLATSGR